jgi:hypothetical protein
MKAIFSGCNTCEVKQKCWNEHWPECNNVANWARDNGLQTSFMTWEIWEKYTKKVKK